MADPKPAPKGFVNGDKKLQGWVSKEDKERVKFLLEHGYILNESDAVREGTRALWREYLAGNLVKIKEAVAQEQKSQVSSES